MSADRVRRIALAMKGAIESSHMDRLDRVDEDMLGEALTLAWRTAAAKPPAKASARRRSRSKSR